MAKSDTILPIFSPKNHLRPFLLMFFLFCGCSILGKDLEKPKVDLQSVSVEKASFTDATLLFHFLVQNSNDAQIQVDRINYALKVNGKPFTQGVLEKGLKIDGKSSLLVPLPVALKYADLGQGLTTLLRQGTTPYEINGSVRLGFISVPFSKTGELKLSNLQK